MCHHASALGTASTCETKLYRCCVQLKPVCLFVLVIPRQQYTTCKTSYSQVVVIAVFQPAVWCWLKFPVWPYMWCPVPPQGSVFPGYEFVPVTDVHLFLVLRHSRHGHRHLHLQIHWVLWVSNHDDSAAPEAGIRSYFSICLSLSVFELNPFFFVPVFIVLA